MPVSSVRSGVGLRPAYRRFRDARFGSNGSISDHSVVYQFFVHRFLVGKTSQKVNTLRCVSR
jgi:hypothetical protein